MTDCEESFICFLFFLFQDGDPHTNHFYIGLWVIMGIFGFLTLEKVFGENEENKSAKKEEVDKEKVIHFALKGEHIY